ncbi:hypothetical protein C8R48DRAFT_711715 [Suillus tomentosus]|nr:hypothetical protein C8R48DRAFT_711715 [Suillus tomentosus]
MVRLGQPFGAFVLSRQRDEKFKRIASDHDIIQVAQFKDMAFISYTSGHLEIRETHYLVGEIEIYREAMICKMLAHTHHSFTRPGSTHTTRVSARK